MKYILHLLVSLCSAARVAKIDGTQYRNMTVWQTLRSLARRSKPEFIGMATALQAPCNQAVLDMLDDPSTTVTLFAPVNEAFMTIFPERIPLRFLGCGDQNCTRSSVQAFPALEFTPMDIRNCLGELVRYHVVPGIQFSALGNLGNSSIAVNVLPTMLNSTFAPGLVRLADDVPQSIIVNQTSNNRVIVNQWVDTGAHRPARIVHKNIQCLNGVIQGVNQVLLPPSDIFRTLHAINPQSALTSLRTPDLAQPISGQSNITMFWPISGFDLASPEQAIRKSVGQLFNYTEYVIPEQIIFNNQTFGQFNATALSGHQRIIGFGEGFNMTVEGIQVVASNILIENGILHLIQHPFEPNVPTNRTA